MNSRSHLDHPVHFPFRRFLRERNLRGRWWENSTAFVIQLTLEWRVLDGGLKGLQGRQERNSNLVAPCQKYMV
jgi:hypothetical protein